MTEAEIEALRRSAEQPVKATMADLDAVANDLSAAFQDDPQFCWFMRDDGRRDSARLDLFKLMVGGVGMPDGVVTRPVMGGAAAVWLPSETMVASPLIEELRILPTILAATGFRRFGRMVAMRETMEKYHPKDRPHAYLWFLGVRPQAQGYGVGSRLLAAGLRDVDAQGRHAYLESSNVANVPLYQRYGFEVVREFIPGPGGPPFYAMWREARPAAT